MDKQNSNQKITNEHVNRPYGCPCGKFYLSYPALFTHIKQKHQGKAPGALIKPVSGKIRGRPKAPAKNKQGMESTKIIEAIKELIKNTTIDYSQQFQKSSGTQTCQDIASLFLSQFHELDEGKTKIIECFLNQLRYNVGVKYNYEFWGQKRTNELIQIANQMFLNHRNVLDVFPMAEGLIKQLIFNFFGWLYAKNYTNHRLARKQNIQ